MAAMTYTLPDMLETPRRRGASMAEDILSDFLRLIHLTGALIFRLDMHGYWSVANSATEASEMTRLLPAGTDQIIVFHIVTKGECWIRHPPGEWVHTRVGEAVVLVHGAAHQIGNRTDVASMSFREALGDRSFLDLRNLHLDLGPGARMQLVGAFLGC